MQERAIEVAGDDGVRLSARAFDPPSAEAPGLLLMHGLASSQHIWDLMLPRLTRRFRVVTYDARGHGRSGKPTSGYGFPHVVADARAVIRGTGLGRPMIAGHSWGAMVALELAAGHPRAIAGAVLVDGGVTSLREHMDWPTAKERLAPPKLIGMPATQFRGMIRTFFADAVHVTPDVEDIVMSVMRVRADGTIAPYLSRANHSPHPPCHLGTGASVALPDGPGAGARHRRASSPRIPTHRSRTRRSGWRSAVCARRPVVAR